jgi:glycosyltransferase involved in cell wall biosynthesis
MRLAWFTPLPPVTSGISDYSAEILPWILEAHAVDVFVATAGELAWGIRHNLPVHDAHEFVWRDHRTRYDLVVYQVGNARCHDYMWPYLFQFPGLVVLHDGHLHHARAWSLLRRGRQREYRAEFEFSHPEAPADAAELAISGFSGPVYYCWPLLGAVVASARVVAVHNAWLADAVREAYPAANVHTIRMGVCDPQDGRSPDAMRTGVRARHGIPTDAFLVTALGAMTPEKRIPQILRAVAATRAWRADIHVLLVGNRSAHYDPMADAEAAGLADRVTLAGFVPDTELPAYLAAADVAMCLRWPTTRETSASWLRCIAAGLPTVVTDLAHETATAALDPRSWTVIHASATRLAPDPVAVSIDILDEDHSLRLALRRLATDEDLRLRLGAAARVFWERNHMLPHMASDYRHAMATAAAAPVPTAALPPHLRPDPLAHARSVLSDVGADPATLDFSLRAPSRPRRSADRGPQGPG